MDKERLINELTEFTIRNYKAKRQGRSTWGTPQCVKEFYRQTLGQTIIKRNDEDEIEAVSTYQIENVDGKEYCVFLTFISENEKYSSVCFLRKFIRNFKNKFGFDSIGIVKDEDNIKWLL